MLTAKNVGGGDMWGTSIDQTVVAVRGFFLISSRYTQMAKANERLKFYFSELGRAPRVACLLRPGWGFIGGEWSQKVVLYISNFVGPAAEGESFQWSSAARKI